MLLKLSQSSTFQNLHIYSPALENYICQVAQAFSYARMVESSIQSVREKNSLDDPSYNGKVRLISSYC